MLPLFEQVLKKYPDQVKIVHKEFPLRNHKYARKAAAAALAARRQEKFWEFHRRLFKDTRGLDDEKIKEIAADLGLDPAQFEKDRMDPEISARIQRDILQGRKAGVRGTPTVFVNGRRLKQRSLQGFQQMIDEALKKHGTGDGEG